MVFRVVPGITCSGPRQGRREEFVAKEAKEKGKEGQHRRRVSRGLRFSWTTWGKGYLGHPWNK